MTDEEVIKRANIAINEGEDLEITWEQFFQCNKDAKEKIVKISEKIKQRQQTPVSYTHLRAHET